MKRAIQILAILIGFVSAVAVIGADKTAVLPKEATTQSPWANSLGMKFVPVKGTAVLFCIWKTRVQDFDVFVKDTGYDATANVESLRDDGWKKTHGDSWKSPGYPQEPTCPVGGMSWNDAQAFCRWLTEMERKDGKIGPHEQYRLPMDAEWSVAVGLGTEPGETPKEKNRKIKGVYPWGKQWPPPRDAGNYAGEEAKVAAPTNSPASDKAKKPYNDVPSEWTLIEGFNDGYARPSPVGSFPANAFGLYDLGSNLYEWCEDFLSKGAPVMRGASFYTYKPAYMLSSNRNSAGVDHRCGGTGFRCVLVSAP
jgi:formylglycine-generating enzyme required for sulfatase activity